MKIKIKFAITMLLIFLISLFSFDTYTVVYSYDNIGEQNVVTYRDYYFMPATKVLNTTSADIRKENIGLDTLKINYYDVLYADENLNKDKIKILGIFNNNRSIDITDVCNISIQNNTIQCSINSITQTLDVPIVGIQSIEFISSSNIYENNQLPAGKIKILYKNNHIKEVKFDENRILTPGRNIFTYKGFDFTIEAKKEPWLHKIVRENKKEIDNADNLYTSDTLVISEKKHSYFDSDYVYISHVFTKNNNQIKVQSSKDKLYDGSTESPITFSERHNPRLLINGGGFNIRSDFMPTRFGSSVYYLDGEHINNVTTSSGTELFISDNGTLFSEEDKTIEELEKLNVHSSLTFKENPLIKDKEKQNLDNYSYAPRSGIGMVKPGEYYVVLAGHSNYSNGLTLAQLRDIFYDLGCTYAFNLDGGGSSTMMIDNKMINESAQSSIRPVVNYICFYD